MKSIHWFIFVVFLAGCAPTPAPASTPAPQIVSVYTNPATEPWLEEVYTCAEKVSVLVSFSASSAVDIRLRLGEPANLTTPAYQIGVEDILVVTHRESPIQNLTVDEARALFSHGQEGVEIWVYASGEDVQEIFEGEIMRGARIHSFARLAASPQQMSDALNAESNAVGILPRRWKAGTVREVFTLAAIPVLAITPKQPTGAIKALLACLQR
jgi:hypothetical protein